VAQGLCTNPALTTADHGFDSGAVAQVGPQTPVQTAGAAPVQPQAPMTPVTQGYPVLSARSAAFTAPPLRNPRLERQQFADLYSPG